MREILEAGFEFIITKIAAEGLNKTWLGRTITHRDVNKLVGLNKKVGFNIAFEGGEAETLVTDCPLFKSEIQILEAEKILENHFTGTYNVVRTRLCQSKN